MPPGGHEEIRAALALASIRQVGPLLFESLTRALGTAARALECSRKHLLEIEGIGPKTADLICAGPDWAEIDRQIAACDALGVRILTSADYPRLLAHIPAPPPVLFVQGSFEDADERSLAIVGTRNPDHYGSRVTRELAGALARRGLTIISGLAMGVDQVAHGAALEAGGRTIAVLGCGHDVDYPRGSAALRKQILGSGAIVSEFAPGTQPLPAHFRQRNRIISGLALGVLLTQGTRKSGAMITVGYALEQNRQVFCVPGPIHSMRSGAPHLFLKQGAALVENADDVFESLPEANTGKRAQGPAEPRQQVLSTQGAAAPKADLSEEERALMDSLAQGQMLHRDELLAHAGLDAGRGAPILLSLELRGLLRAHPGGHYSSN
ncbi:MAG: DNA-processing protein DprA [Chrysiogenetes bacterium]|nr:DNA-processing protein DprA [Chrysiogenetes bacterium]